MPHKPAPLGRMCGQRQPPAGPLRTIVAEEVGTKRSRHAGWGFPSGGAQVSVRAVCRHARARARASTTPGYLPGNLSLLNRGLEPTDNSFDPFI